MPRLPARQSATTETVLLEELLRQEPATPVQRPARRARTRHDTHFIDVIYTWVTVLGVLGLCVWMWKTGADFTLAALNGLGAPVASWGLAAYLIPLSVTMMQIRLMPGARVRDMSGTLIWLVITLFDVGSTVLGVYPWLTEQSQVVLGITVAVQDAWWVALCVGFSLAFFPEPLARYILTLLE